MRRIAALLITVLLLPALAVLTGGSAAEGASGPSNRPAVKKVDRAYGGAAVRLRPRQGLAISFHARRGDRVMLDVRSRRFAQSPCFGRQTLVDRRGARSVRLAGPGSARVMKVRTTGRVVLRFRGYCAYNRGQAAHPTRVQLTKVRMRKVGRNAQKHVRMPRRGYLDIAWVRVAKHGRDTLTLRDADGTTQLVRHARVLRGDALVPSTFTNGISVEAGHRLVIRPATWTYPGRLRRGERVGLVAAHGGYAESLRAEVHQVALDDPAITLAAEPGREHVLVYAASAADRPYVITPGLEPAGGDIADPSFLPWQIYSGGGVRGNSSMRRTIVSSDPDGEGSDSLPVRVRRTVRVADLVVDGAPVTFASAEPGTRFVTTIPGSASGTVRLTASDVSATGKWGTEVPQAASGTDSYFPGLGVSQDHPVVNGSLPSEAPHELTFTFASNSTGSVTLQLTDIP